MEVEPMNNTKAYILKYIMNIYRDHLTGYMGVQRYDCLVTQLDYNQVWSHGLVQVHSANIQRPIVEYIIMHQAIY